MKNKKGLSQIIGTLLMVLLAISMIAAVWTTLDKFVLKKLDDAEACYGITEEITLNPRYTCYDNTINKTLVSINLKDIEIDGLLVSVDYDTDSTVFELTAENDTSGEVTNYPDGNIGVVMPKPDSGRTYIVERAGKPTKVYLAPRVGLKQCDVIDSIQNLPYCI